MTTPPTPPSPGKPISASFFARLIGWVKSGMLVEGTGYRLRRGPNGTALEIEVAKSVRPVAKIPGCFEIRRPSPAASEGGEADPGGFDNPYYMVGSRIYQCAEAIDMGFVFRDCIIALGINTASDDPQASIWSLINFTDLQNASKDRLVAFYPLYLIGSRGEVLADLRNIPVFPQWEYKED